MKREDVADVLDEIGKEKGYPQYLQSDNRLEFRSTKLSKWCKINNVTQIFSRPGKPIDNCFIESFNGTFGNECLNIYYFEALDSARKIIEHWRQNYNRKRPPESVNIVVG